jgi:hypothetical protein
MSSLVWRAMVVTLLAVGCGAEGEQPVDVSRTGDAAASSGGNCVDPMLGNTGPSTVRGSTPLGEFVAAGARALGRCVWLELVSVDGSKCQRQVITAATGLRVPPWGAAEGSRWSVGIEIKGNEPGAPQIAAGSLTVDMVMNADGDKPVARGTLTVRQPNWNLQGNFEAPWTDQPCN